MGGPSLAAVSGPRAPDPGPSDSGRVRVVMVDAPTVADRNQVVALGLDITEHVTTKGIEVVLYDDRDAQTLRDAGFTWDVEVRDLEEQARKQRKADRAYAARVARSPLPSGRTEYRTYAEYLSDMADLAASYPRLTRPLTLANRTVLGAVDPRPRDHDRRRQHPGRQAGVPADGRPPRPGVAQLRAHDRVRHRPDQVVPERRRPRRQHHEELAAGHRSRRQRRRLPDLAQRPTARRLLAVRLRDEAQELQHLGVDALRRPRRPR